MNINAGNTFLPHSSLIILVFMEMFLKVIIATNDNKGSTPTEGMCLPAPKKINFI
jgi:hypothetical protein